MSRASYDGQLEDAPEVQAYEFVTRKPLPVALHFVDTDGMRGSRERRGPGGTLRNETEVRVAAHVVRLLDERCSRELSMAVIAMYAEQVERLRQALGRRKFKRSVKIDTVDSFEGREEDLVVISLVRSNERGRIGFLRVPNRLNVAVSRARRLVVCIGDAATLRSGEESMYGVLVEAARESGGYIPAAEVMSPRRRPDHTFGSDGEAGLGEGAPSRRRRRRRRGGAAGQAPPALQPDGQPIAPAEEVAGAEGEAGQTARRRRRRRRRGGTHPEMAGGVPGPDGQAQLSGEAGAPSGEGQPSARSRRRRRHRHGPRPQGPTAAGGPDGSDRPARDGGEGMGGGPSGPPAPAAEG